MKIGIANDHGGYELKFNLTRILEEKGYTIVNYGSDTSERVDYPDYAFKLCQGVINNEIDAKYSKCHNNANVLAFTAHKSEDEIIKLIEIFINNTFEGDRHQNRLDLIMEYENAN